MPEGQAALFARQVDPALQAREISVELDMDQFGAEFAELLTGINSTESGQDAQRRVGAYALAARTVPETERRATVSSRLPSPDWPSRRMLLVAVDAETGETRVFDRGADTRKYSRWLLRRPVKGSGAMPHMHLLPHPSPVPQLAQEGGYFAWWIRAWRRIRCAGIHPIRHGARIYHDLSPGRRTTARSCLTARRVSPDIRGT